MTATPAFDAVTRPRSPALPSHIERVHAAIADIRDVVPPVWPLEDYVAVNPFQGVAKIGRAHV